jgi:hypothetical protein
MPAADYCREIETYLCRKNDGHLIRIVGPAFEQVRGWESQGVPLKVVFAGIDRYFERYYARGPRRRPVRIEFCEADVLDAFDSWRRALNLTGADLGAEPAKPARARQGLQSHVDRVIARLTARRVAEQASPLADVLDSAVARLDALRADARAPRGERREAALATLEAIDRELAAAARGALTPDRISDIERDADEELRPFRDRMAADDFARARDAAIEKLIRERAGLPLLRFDG